MSQLTRLSALTGYALHNNIAYGRTNGIYFNVALEPDIPATTVRAYIRPIESLTFHDTGRGAGIDVHRIDEYLRVRRREFSNNGALADEQSVRTTLSGEALNAEKISEFLYSFSRFLSDRGYVSSCAMCPATRNLVHTARDGQVLELCNPCCERLDGAVPLESGKSGSYLRGLAGALLGGLVGIPVWALCGFAGYAASLCGLLMAYLAYKGYRLMRGKSGAGMLPVIAAVLLVFTYIAVMACEGVNAFRLHPGEGPGLFADIVAKMTALFHPEAQDARLLWIRLGTGWLFSALGCAGLLLRQRRESGISRKTTHIGQQR